MIGLHCNWPGLPLDAALADRFAASLGVGLLHNVLYHIAGGATAASLVKNHTGGKRWSPPLSPRGDLVLFTGHIDNRDELLSNLPKRFDRHCDDATLYGLCHSAWGDACDLKLVGQYAAILWSVGNQETRLVRSPIQAPPLHIWRGENQLIIASTPRAIFATGEVRQEIDEQKIADSLFLNYMEAERGWFRGVSRLPVGTNAVITAEGMTIRKYYDPFVSGSIVFPRDEDYVEAANALFEDGIRAALKGFSKPAVSLSGGYDSQTVAAHTLRAMSGDRRLLGLTSVPEAGWDGRTKPNRVGDESQHVKALADMYSALDIEFVDAAGLGFDHKLDAVFLMAGCPPRNAMNLHWIHEIRSRAKAVNCDVLLTGAMGNATFSFDGTGAYLGWLRNGKWATFAREVWAIQSNHKSLGHAIAAHLILPLLPYAIAKSVMKMRQKDRPDVFDSWCPLNTEWAIETGVLKRAAEIGFDPMFSPPRSTRGLRMAIVGNAMNEVGDIEMAMDAISGIPSRDPTSYRPLLEFCFNIPDDQYLRNGQKRWLAKRMLKGIVPDMVLDETRKGQQAADKHMRLARQLAQLKNEIDQLAADPKMAEMLNLPRLRKSLDDWPGKTPVDSSDPYLTAPLALSRALTTARFIRYVDGGNR